MKSRRVYEKIKLLSFIIAIFAVFSFGAACSSVDTEIPENPEVDNSINYDKEIASLTLNGKTDYKIVISNTATVTEVNAASIMRDYVRQSSGAILDVVTEGTLPENAFGGKYIYIGGTQSFKNSGLSSSNLNIDGFIINSTENSIIIKGQRDRGTLYGVYDFLER